MQFSVLIVAAFAAAAIAIPTNDECSDKGDKGDKGDKDHKSTKTPAQSSTETSSSAQATSTLTNGQQLQQQCGNNQKLSCCDSVQKQTFNGIPVAVGINCVTINGLFPWSSPVRTEQPS